VLVGQQPGCSCKRSRVHPSSPPPATPVRRSVNLQVVADKVSDGGIGVALPTPEGVARPLCGAVGQMEHHCELTISSTSQQGPPDRGVEEQQADDLVGTAPIGPRVVGVANGE